MFLADVQKTGMRDTAALNCHSCLQTAWSS